MDNLTVMGIFTTRPCLSHDSFFAAVTCGHEQGCRLLLYKRSSVLSDRPATNKTQNPAKWEPVSLRKPGPYFFIWGFSHYGPPIALSFQGLINRADSLRKGQVAQNLAVFYLAPAFTSCCPGLVQRLFIFLEMLLSVLNSGIDMLDFRRIFSLGLQLGE